MALGLSLVAAMVAATTASVTPAAAIVTPCAGYVAPIATSGFPTTPTDTFSSRVSQTLRNSSKYALGGWWNTDKNFDAQSASTYLDFGGVGENQIRDPSNAAMVLGVSMVTGSYDAVYTGVSTAAAKAILVKTISSLAYRHTVNLGSTGWGNVWQSALWATNAGAAAWMVWGDLPAADRERVCAMVSYEADRFLTAAPGYYRNTAGTVLYPGDTQAESDGWNSGILALAAAMMPTHPNHATWEKQAIGYALAAQSRPNDRSLWGTSVVNGQTLNTWLNGSNLYDDGTLVNHSIVHPEYEVASTLAAQGVAFQSLAQKPSAHGFVRGFTVAYRSLVDQVWTPGPLPSMYSIDSSMAGKTVLAPGGKIYHNTTSSATDHSDLYFPMGNDWGPAARGTFTLLDAIGDAGTIPGGDRIDQAASLHGDYWGPIHALKTLNQQARYTDGHTYSGSAEFNYVGREMQSGQLSSWAYLFRWLKANGKVNITNASHSTY